VRALSADDRSEMHRAARRDTDAALIVGIGTGGAYLHAVSPISPIMAPGSPGRRRLEPGA
jgi:hypothetical protein